MTPFSIIITAFALFALSRSYLRFRDKTIGAPQLVAWVVIWATVVYFVFNPHQSDAIAKSLGVQNGANAFFALAIVALFYSVFRLYAKLDRQNKQIATLVRKLALKNQKHFNNQSQN